MASSVSEHSRVRFTTRRGNSEVSDLSSGDREPQRRLPPIKAPVGLAKGPDLKNCRSKVGSLNNIKHTPKGSGVQIQSQKLKWEAKSKVGSLDNKEHKPGGGNLKVETRKLEWKTTSKVQSLQNINHKPGGGKVKIFNDAYVQHAAEITELNDPQGVAQLNSSNSNTAEQLNAKMKVLNIRK